MDRTAYFNNAATTFPKPEEVYSFVDKFYRESGVNLGRGRNSSVSKLTQDTRNLLLDLFHCPAKKVVFSPSATEAINIISDFLFRIIITFLFSPLSIMLFIRVLNYLQGLYKLNIITLSVNSMN